jgi:hypothetical protein
MQQEQTPVEVEEPAKVPASDRPTTLAAAAEVGEETNPASNAAEDRGGVVVRRSRCRGRSRLAQEIWLRDACGDGAGRGKGLWRGYACCRGHTGRILASLR